jgi:hypothetical protein
MQPAGSISVGREIRRTSIYVTNSSFEYCTDFYINDILNRCPLGNNGCAISFTAAVRTYRRLVKLISEAPCFP